MSQPQSQPIREYHVFLGSPGDVDAERQAVRAFFDEFNRTIARPQWGVQFTVIDWENYTTAGVGRAQELITQQTLEKHRDSLALVIFLMGQRFGSPTGTHESGTEEEFERALVENRKNGFPEIKWFFRDAELFTAPKDPKQAELALEQWKKVCAFREKLQESGPRQSYYKEFKPADFTTVFRNDVQQWLCNPQRPWCVRQGADSAALNRLHQLPTPPSDFVGREAETKEILAKMATGGAVISGAFGMGGIGKTALALVIADKLKAQYPDAQFYLDLRGSESTPLKPEDALAHVIHGYHPQDKLPDLLADLQVIYRSVLDGKRVLLLMDNARDAAQVEPLIPPNGCVLLITSRNEFRLPGLFAKQLPEMPIEDARKLLLSICPRIGVHADAFAKACAFLPQALRVTAAGLEVTRNLTPEEYIARMRDEKRRTKELDEVYDKAFATSDALLTDDLRANWYSLSVFPADFDVAAGAAVFNVAPPLVGGALVSDTRSAPAPPTRGGATPESADQSVERKRHDSSPLTKGGPQGGSLDTATDALGGLIRRSLLLFDDSTTRYRLHDLVRTYTAARMDAKATDAARHRHAAYFLSVLLRVDALSKASADGLLGALALFDSERRNILAGFGWASDGAANDRFKAALCNAYPSLSVVVLELRMHSNVRVVWFERALVASRFLKDRASEARTLGNLANVYTDSGDARKGIALGQVALAIFREIGDRKGETTRLASLGCAYGAIGDAPRALEHLSAALAASGTLDERDEVIVQGNLGNAYRALDRIPEAIACWKRQLALAHARRDLRSEGTALVALGRCLAPVSPLEAIELLQAALGMSGNLSDRRLEGYALSGLGLANLTLRRVDMAAGYFEQAQRAARDCGDRLAEASAGWQLGTTYLLPGRNVKRGLDLLQGCVDFEREIGHADAEKHAAIVAALRVQLPKTP